MNVAIEKNLPHFVPASDPRIVFTGRTQKTTNSLVRYWAPGVYFTLKMKGSDAIILINDEVLYGNTHNYVEIIIDDFPPVRLQTKASSNAIKIQGLSAGIHTITVCKDTESGNGSLELAGVQCDQLLAPGKQPSLKIEFIGNSITCGFGADTSAVGCDKGTWFDQHNAWLSYGPLTARAFSAQYHLSAVSGIGLMHSCCNMDITMPQVFDKINMRDDSLSWDFKKYVPDLVTICLGQNDGIQDSTVFCKTYIAFLQSLRQKYRNAHFVLLTSPMGDKALTAALKKYTESIKHFLAKSDSNISTYVFKKQYIGGCASHPTIEEQRQIADELISFLKQSQSNWLKNPEKL